MKTMLKYLAMAAVAVASMTACSNEAEEASLQGAKYPVQFTMNVNGSRTVTATDAARTTTWVDGDAVGIFVYKHGTTELVNTNAKYVLAGDTWSAADDASKIYADEAYDFFAYYPYDETVTDPKQVSTAVLADQTTADNYGKSDFLSAKNVSVAAGATNVPLAFSHLFSMVEVKVQGDKVAQKPTKVTLNNVKLSATVDITADAPAATLAADASAQTVDMYYLEKTENADAAPFVFRAVVPAQEVAAETSLVSIENPVGDGKTYSMKYSAAVSYEAGKCRQLIVSIANAAAPVLTIPATDFTFNPWGTSGEISGEGGEDVPVVTTLTPELTTSTVFKELGAYASNKPTTGDEDFWFTRFQNTDPATATVVEEDGVTAVQVTMGASSRNAWNGNPVGYHCASTFERATYTLSYEVKAPGAGADPNSIGGGIVIRTADDKKAFRMLNADGKEKSCHTFTIRNENWNKGSVTLDFTQATTEVKSSAIVVDRETNTYKFEASTDDDVKGLQIYFYDNKAGTTMLLRNVKLEKKVE